MDTDEQTDPAPTAPSSAVPSSTVPSSTGPGSTESGSNEPSSPADRARSSGRALAGHIDHTLLAPTATASEVAALCHEAVRLEVAAACVSPRWVSVAADVLTGPETPVVCTVVGFPSGAHTSSAKWSEATLAVAQGATEIDMVVALGDVLVADWDAVRDDVAAVRAAVTDGRTLKVIVESAALTDDALRQACLAAVDGGADYVKTSTGFHPAGGATIHAVELMRTAVGDDIGVKASGGIRDLATARAMLAAGASRLGMSASAAVIAEADAVG